MPLTKYTKGIEFHDLNLKPGKISQIKLKNSNVVIANVYWNSLYKITIKPANKTGQAWLNNYKYLKAHKIYTCATNIKIKTDNTKTQARYTLPSGKQKIVTYATCPSVVYNTKVK